MRHILLAHDQVEGPSARRHLLECAGFRVTVVANSVECLSALATDIPDLALVDVLVEGQNGFELCSAIRRKYAVRDLPIVLTSAIYTGDLFRREASRVGAQAYLVDARDFEALLLAVQHALAAHDADGAQAAA